jgi:hypothetical protein
MQVIGNVSYKDDNGTHAYQGGHAHVQRKQALLGNISCY